MGISNFNPPAPPSGGSNNVPGGNNGINLSLPGGDIDPMEMLINYNKKFGNAGTILFRDEVIQQVLGTLIAKNKPNALLIGSAGVGKTKIVEDIAYRLVTQDGIIPDKLKGSTIYELPLSNIVAGSSFVGQVEEKIKAVLEFITEPKNQAILFIDEIHQLCGESQTYDKIAQILKPALSRGNIRVIGATTLQEANKLTDDPALNRRFSRVIVDEFTKDQTIEILKNSRAGFVTHYMNKISLGDDLMESVVAIADEYKPAGSHRPDNALTLLDRTIGDAIVARKVAEENAKNDPNMLQLIRSVLLIPITNKQLKKTALRLATGSAKKTDFDEAAIRQAMSYIKGQDDVIDNIVNMLRRNDMNLHPKTAPLTLLFAGSSGVGKTEITKIIGKELTGTRPITLNMNEYHSSASINRIIGSPAGYIGSDSSIELPFDSLESNPYQVILLDEFEKGDKAVQTLFMTVFDEGYMKTSRGKTLDFSRCIIIATTNAGQTATNRPLGFTTGLPTEKSIKSESRNLTKWFPPELLNRMTVLTFNDLDEATYRQIVVELYQSEIDRIHVDKPRLTLLPAIPDDVLDKIVKDTYLPEFGARPARKAVRDFIDDQV